MRNAIIVPIKMYRKYISPLKGHSTCRFYPTCSEYAIQAITKYGSLRGSVKAAGRILRCNPFCKGGYDPCE